MSELTQLALGITGAMFILFGMVLFAILLCALCYLFDKLVQAITTTRQGGVRQ